MSSAWSRLPHWSTLVAKWTESMERHGAPVDSGFTTVFDVVCEDLSELRMVAGIQRLWLERGSDFLAEAIPASHLITLASLQSHNPDAAELLRVLTETNGNPELIAAALIAATAAGYHDYGDSLQMAGQLAIAALRAAGIDLPRQSKRPSFLMEDRFDIGSMDISRLPDALAREHSGIFRSHVAGRVRFLIRTESGVRVASAEEMRIGLLNEFSLAFGATTTSVTALQVTGEKKDPTKVALSGLPHKERSTILDAIMQGIAPLGTEIDEVVAYNPEKLSSSYFGSPLHARLDTTSKKGWVLRVSRPTLLTITPEASDTCTTRIDLKGHIDSPDLEKLSKLICRAVDSGRRLDDERFHINDWERVDPRDIRIDPLTRRLAELRDLDLLQDVQWRVGEGGNETPDPVSSKPVRSIGLRVTDRRLHIIRQWLSCPRDGGLLIEDDGQRQIIRTPRHIPRSCLDQPISEVLTHPDLADIDEVFVDSIVADSEGWTTLYLRSRTTSLPFPDENRSRR